MAATKIDFLVFDVPEQEPVITATGSGLLLLQGNADPAQAEPEELRPDVVEVFVACARLGMFCGRFYQPAQSSAELLARRFDPTGPSQTWRLRLQRVDAGAYRVLVNLLTALGLQRLTISPSPEAETTGSKTLTLTTVPSHYPLAYRQLPMTVDHVPGSRSRDRVVQIRFVHEPTDEVLSTAYAALETWTTLLMLGGYAPDGTPAEQSWVLPDLAFLLDPTTVEQSFPEAFVADESAFFALLNWAVRLHQQCPVARITIR